MKNSSENESRSKDLSSVSEDGRGRDAPLLGGVRSRRAGANSRPDEITALERRVLAHERILQALLGHLADDDPEILRQLKTRFGNGHNLGEYEQDYVSTDHYGDHFIRAIEIEVAERQRGFDAAQTGRGAVT